MTVEQIGLLREPARRTPARYRRYGQADQDRLGFITRAKAIELTLHKILALRDDGRRPCVRVVELLDRKLRAAERQLQALSPR